MFVAPQIIGSCCAKDSVESVEQPWRMSHPHSRNSSRCRILLSEYRRETFGKLLGNSAIPISANWKLNLITQMALPPI